MINDVLMGSKELQLIDERIALYTQRIGMLKGKRKLASVRNGYKDIIEELNMIRDVMVSNIVNSQLRDKTAVQSWYHQD